jgi:hypothetical protein
VRQIIQIDLGKAQQGKELFGLHGSGAVQGLQEIEKFYLSV